MWEVLVNYLIFEYGENYYISKERRGTIEQSEELKKLSKEMYGLPDLGCCNVSNNYGIGYDPIEMENIPNLLSREFAI